MQYNEKKIHMANAKDYSNAPCTLCQSFEKVATAHLAFFHNMKSVVEQKPIWTKT